MHDVRAPKRLLTGLLAFVLAAMLAQSAAARVIPDLSDGIAVAVAQSHGVEVTAPSVKIKYFTYRKDVPLKQGQIASFRKGLGWWASTSPVVSVTPPTVSATPTTTWFAPPGCVLGYTDPDNYVYGYTCSP